MTLETGEFMRRFLLHVLPVGFHRLRHYGLLANPVRRSNLANARELLQVVAEVNTSPEETLVETRPAFISRHCGAPMIIIDSRTEIEMSVRSGTLRKHSVSLAECLTFFGAFSSSTVDFDKSVTDPAQCGCGQSRTC